MSAGAGEDMVQSALQCYLLRVEHSLPGRQLAVCYVTSLQSVLVL